jgi:hypothetical protein
MCWAELIDVRLDTKTPAKQCERESIIRRVRTFTQ